ncbi:MAG: fabG-A [Parachlamydiales bacterium]|nr:fabG-A [Parachlamydiales bacterium]
MQFTGKTVLVTGGSAGIGREIALAFAKNGASVAIFGTNEERSQGVVREMESLKIDNAQRFGYYLVDVSKTKEVETTILQLLSAWGQVDILVNNAGITRDNLLMRMSEEDWDLVVDVNLKSIYNTCRILARPMMKARAGKIINITSVIGLTGNAGQVNYSASKAGMIGFTKSLAKELASRGICVNCVAPGYIQTQMTEGLSPQVKNEVLSKVPLSRIGQPSEVAHAVLFLASDQANYITGQVLTVDGGMVM